MRFSNKKGAVEVQFNWIFVLIVGALILVFFINISNAQRKSADQTLAYDLLSKVDLIMNGALTIPKTGQVFDMPNIPFNLECNRVTALGVSRQFPDRITFGPDELKGKKLVIWSQDWTVPFKVSNFLYLTTSNVRYVIVANSDDPQYSVAEDWYNKLPENITKEISNLSSLKDKKNYKIKLIFLSQIDPLEGTAGYDNLTNMQLPDFIKNLPNGAVSGAYINEDSIRFIVKEQDPIKGAYLNFDGATETKIYGDPMIFGAIFAENLEEFNCSYAKAFERLHYVSEVYQTRETELIDAYRGEYSDRVECSNFTGTRSPDFIARISEEATAMNIEGISAAAETVASDNNAALRASCAPIY